MEEVLNQISPLQQLIDQVILFLPKLIVAIIIFLITLYVANLGYRMVEKATRKRNVNAEVSLLLARITQITILVLGVIWSLATVDFNVTGFVAGLGIAGFTIGFALQDIAQNFVAGILLLLQQPFEIGHAVEAGGYGGVVTDIEIRSTTLRTWDGLIVIIPNSQVYSNPITNFSRVEKRRLEVLVGVGYDTDLNKARAALLDVAAQTPGILEDPAPIAVFKEFGDSSINASFYFWIDPSATGYFDALHAVVEAVKTKFEQEGIDIPFPIRTLYMEKQA